MDGIHDMGGMHGFGPVEQEEDEPLFHGDWERRILACTLAVGSHGRWNIDISRQARERTRPDLYLRYSYYEIWLDALERLLVEHGLMSEAEIKSGNADPTTITDAKPLRVIQADQVAAALQRGSSMRRDAGEGHRFRPGDKVRVKNIHPAGHTRAPRYVRGHVGEVVLDHGFQILPDASARGEEEVADRLYTVRFTMAELWGEEGSSKDGLNADLWDSYLDPA